MNEKPLINAGEEKILSLAKTRSVRHKNFTNASCMITTGQLTEQIVLENLRQVIDPEIGCNIVDLGLVYSVSIEGGAVKVVMTLTTPGCPMHESITWGVQNVLLQIEGVTLADVELVWDPPWHPSMMTDVGRTMTGAGNF